MADEEGDWAFHCHKSHHTMNAMGHNVPTMIGVDQGDLAPGLRKLVPGYMPMGEAGMHEMADMVMPLPANTAPMMTGEGPFGPLGMGGMFSVLKVRRDQPRGDYRDPGDFAHPPGSVAREWTAALGEARRPAAAGGAAAAPAGVGSAVELKVRKPGGHAGH